MTERKPIREILKEHTFVNEPDEHDNQRIPQKNCYVLPPDKCDKCGADNFAYKFIVCGGTEALMVRSICLDCGWETNLKQFKEKPPQREISVQNRWAQRVKWRDKERCVICGNTNDIVAHHIIPYANCPNSETAWAIGNGITLCKKHHEMVHPWMKKEELE